MLFWATRGLSALGICKESIIRHFKANENLNLDAKHDQVIKVQEATEDICTFIEK